MYFEYENNSNTNTDLKGDSDGDVQICTSKYSRVVYPTKEHSKYMFNVCLRSVFANFVLQKEQQLSPHQG